MRKCFNPRSRMGSDCAHRRLYGSDADVSTHAPAWGATENLEESVQTAGFNPRSRMGSDTFTQIRPQDRDVSTHAPAWGATLAAANSARFSLVSTHAPAWGATVNGHSIADIIEFQPTLPHGERHIHLYVYRYVCMFQPTLPHGERPHKMGTTWIDVCFNPRSRMGSDPCAIIHVCTSSVSTHAPAWGATLIKD